jgi:hypothetical protein
MREYSIEWRDMTSARRRAAVAIGRWPGERVSAKALALAGGTVLGSPSFRHARDTWEECARLASWNVTGSGERLAALAMVAELASHLGGCSRCWRTGPYDSRTPVAWLMWAVARRPGIAELVGPVLADVAGSRLDRTLGSLG